MELRSSVNPGLTLSQVKEIGKIGVLMGGPSNERDISIKSGTAVLDNLRLVGVDALGIVIENDNPKDNSDLIKSKGINCAFIALHGRFGEDGGIQEILDGLGIPYTGSGADASRLAMDKLASRRIFQNNALAVPRYKTVQSIKVSFEEVTNGWQSKSPLVIKPVSSGSSIGLSIIEKKEDFPDALRAAFEFDSQVLVEEYVAGSELTVGILDEQALPVIEVVPKNKFFDFEAKYKSGMTDYIVPAVLDEESVFKVQAAGLSAHKLLGCYGASRVDIILSKTGIPVVLEVNTIPGMTATSLLPKAAKCVGIDFVGLCLMLIKLSYAKAKIKTSV